MTPVRAGGLVDVLSLLPRAAAVELTPLSRAVFAAIRDTVLEVRDVGPDGLVLPFAWDGLAGTDGLELDRLTVTVAPPTDEPDFPGIPLGELPSALEDGQVVVDVPGGRRVRALHFDAFAAGGSPLVEHADLGSRRLTVSAWDANAGGWAAPVVAVPAVAPRGQVPATLTGGSFSGRVLRLPDLAGSRLKVALVDGATPEVFAPSAVTVGKVTGWAAPVPVDLRVTGPDGQELWSFPGELLPGGPGHDVDLTVGLTSSLAARLSEGRPLTGTVTVTAAKPAHVRLGPFAVSGRLTRTLAGITTVTLAGEPVLLPISGPALPATPPSTVVADVTVTYVGARLDPVSDPLPEPPVVGTVVGADPVRRVLPPGALRGASVVRIGLVGWCPEPSEVSVRLVSAKTDAGTDGAGQQGEPLGPPGVAGPPTTTSVGAPGVVWVDLPAHSSIDVPVAVEVTATRGRFLWVGDPQPLVRVAVADPDPGGRVVQVGPAALLSLSAPQVTVERAVLPTGPFTGPAAPVLVSALFCTVELTDLRLIYERSTT